MKLTQTLVVVFLVALQSTCFSHDWKEIKKAIGSQPDSAVRQANQAISATLASDSSSAATHVTQFGRALANRRKFELAFQWFSKYGQQLSAYYKENPQSAAEFYMNFGRAYAMKGNYRQAIPHYSKSFKITDKNNLDTPSIFYLTRSLGYLYFNLDQYQTAIKWHKKSLDNAIKTEGKMSVDVADAYNNLGLIYPHLNEPELALYYYKSSLDILLKIDPEDINVASIYNNSGLVKMDQGKYEEALSWIKKAVEFHKKNGEVKSQWASATNNLGLAKLHLKQYKEAIQDFHQALFLKRQIFDPMSQPIATTYQNLGKTYIELGKIDSAAYYFKKGFLICNKLFEGKGQAVAESHIDLMKVSLSKNDISSAKSQGKKAIKALSGSDSLSISTINSHYKIWIKLLTTLGDLHLQILGHQHNLDEKLSAYKYYHLAIKTIAKQQNDFLSRESKIFLSQKSSQIIQKFMSLGVELFNNTGNPKYAEAAFQTMENEKSFILLSTLQQGEHNGWMGVPDSLVDKQATLNADLQLAKKKLYAAKLNNDSIDMELANESIVKDLREKQNLKTILEQLNPSYALSSYEELDIQNVRDFIPPNSSLVSYWSGPDYIFGIGISSGNIEMIKLPINQVGELKNKLLSSAKASKNDSFALYAYNFHQTILNPLISGKESQLIIIPGIHLSQVPFEILISKQPNNNAFNSLEYLIKNKTISYHYSTRVMMLPKDNSITNKKFIGFAPGYEQESQTLLAKRSASDSALMASLNKLPYAKKEVMTIAEMWQGKSLVDSSATESRFKKLSQNSDIIHVASHAILNEEDPLYSRIVFSKPDNNSAEDGLLYLYELLSMNLNASMITLSACNSGVGKGFEGEGVMSVARGFMYAGVPNVTMSLWSVPDKSTSEIMQTFYENMKKGYSKAEALRQAKLEYLSTADNITASPYYWAGFVFIGEPEASSKNLNLWMLIMLAGLVSAIVLYTMKKKKVKARQ